MSDVPPISTPPAAPSWRRAGTFKIAALVLVSAIAGAAVSRAAHHWHGHHWGRGIMSGPIDPADVDRAVDRMTSRLARDVRASDDQREKLAAIAKTAAKDLLPMRETMNRAAIEKLRADQLANFDTISKRMSAALADAAEVLTPEQRKELAQRMPPFGGWRYDKDRS
jgi:Spy/CpxP family protein refolding chaperone